MKQYVLYVLTFDIYIYFTFCENIKTYQQVTVNIISAN